MDNLCYCLAESVLSFLQKSLGSGLWSLFLVLYYRTRHGSWLSRIVRPFGRQFFPTLYGRVGWIAVNRLLFSAVLPGRLYKVHTPCVNYHFRKKTQKLLWLCTSSFPLFTPWHLFRMICLFVFFSSRLIPPSSISGVYVSSGRGHQFFPTLYRRLGWISVNQGLLCADFTLSLHTFAHEQIWGGCIFFVQWLWLYLFLFHDRNRQEVAFILYMYLLVHFT